jgi:deoxyribonuclease V
MLSTTILGRSLTTLLACLDVAYAGDRAHAACVLFDGWRADAPASSVTRWTSDIAPYEPGAFYRRELPVLLTVLEAAATDYATVIVDGYVWLDAQSKPGLGARLYEALSKRVPVIGAAKTMFRGDDWSIRAYRGKSQRPLFITAAGMDASAAAANIVEMHGEGRMPTMLRLVDRMARSEVCKPSAGEL